ncbi:hypothetical protein KC363_g154 [Hortaea werneckii]|nr:hypothetical protein KC363_g154 [Hortaea werneckii]
MSQYPEGEKKKEKKDNSMLYGVGGLAAGALIGGVVAHEMTEDSDDEKQAAAAPAQQQYPPPQSYGEPQPDPYGDPYGGGPPPEDDGPPPVLPAEDADGDSVSSSDREEVQEAREDYEEALAEASSSSDEEEVQEAREEYEEAYEDNYESCLHISKRPFQIVLSLWLWYFSMLSNVYVVSRFCRIKLLQSFRDSRWWTAPYPPGAAGSAAVASPII